MPPDVVTLEVKQVAEKRMNAEAETNPQVDIRWHTVPFGHKDSYALEILAQILSTRTGRLYKGLVLGAQVADRGQCGPGFTQVGRLFQSQRRSRRTGTTPRRSSKAFTPRWTS